MNHPIKPISDDLGHLAKHANDLISATAEATEDKIVEARNRLADVLQRGREIYNHAGESAGARCMAADLLMRRNLYSVIAIGIGVGMLAGYLANSCRTCHRD
ncbi:MAG: hypothetical protein ABI600_15155 [Luteolibacter sp.]